MSPRIAYEAVDLDDGVTGGQSNSGGGGLGLNYSRLGLGLRPPTIKGVSSPDDGTATHLIGETFATILRGFAPSLSSKTVSEIQALLDGNEIVVIADPNDLDLVAGRAERHARKREVAQQYNFTSITGVNFDSSRVQSLRAANPLFVNQGPTQQYMLGDGSLFTGTPAALDKFKQQRDMQAKFDDMGKLTGSTIGGIALGASREMGADPATQQLFYGLGSSADGLLLSGAALRGGSITPYTGQNSLNIVNAENGTHGNSRLSGRTTWLYELSQRNPDGTQTFLKYGISVNPVTRYSKSFMVGKIIDPIASGTRADMLSLERQMVISNPGPLNNEPWAVKARGGN